MNKVRELRQEYNMTRAEFAPLLGLSDKMLNNIEKQQRVNVETFANVVAYILSERDPLALDTVVTEGAGAKCIRLSENRVQELKRGEVFRVVDDGELYIALGESCGLEYYERVEGVLRQREGGKAD